MADELSSAGLARAVLESASEAIVIANRAGTIVMVNAQTESLFGYTREELIGQRLDILVPDHARGAHEAHRRTYAESPRIRSMGQGRDLSGRRKDGSEFPVEISLSFTETDQGPVYIAFVTDITERQRSIDALRRSEAKARAILENASEGIVVVDATGRIVSVNAKTEQMFRHDRAALVGQPLEILMPERLRGRHVAAGIAHEVNNPVGIITSRIELMLMEAEEHGLPAAVVDDLRVLHRHALRVTDIAAKVLTFARESPADRQPVDINAVVTDALALVQKQLDHSGIHVERRLGSGIPRVFGHANALQQVVLNLLTNAGQALADHGTIRIVTAAGDAHVTVEVADDGPGIPPSTLSHVFDPFFTTKVSGTGLGLSVSYGIVRDHGGTMDVRSEVGHGTVFMVSLPILRAEG